MQQQRGFRRALCGGRRCWWRFRWSRLRCVVDGGNSRFPSGMTKGEWQERWSWQEQRQGQSQRQTAILNGQRSLRFWRTMEGEG